MRIGIFSDVHANLEALQAVLSAYQQAKIDCYICLGDTVGYGANPNECCQIVRDLTDLVILGNHDAACSGRMSPEWFNAAARVAVEGHQRMLKTTHMHWLAQLPYRIERDDMLLCHGSPYQQEEFFYVLDEADVDAIVQHSAASQSLIFVGHTHRGTTFIVREQPALRIWEDTRPMVHILPEHRYIFNVGSVGQPRDGDWRASYGIFDTAARTFELRRAEYDVDSASEKIVRLGFPLTLSERLFHGL
jgi:diadenosine tetraphosphatase ApaH/serine/threonine PP2A family protein phosphatase